MRILRLIVALGLALLGRAWAEWPVLPQPATSFGATMAEGWLYIYGGNSGKAHEFHRDCVKGDFFRLKVPEGKEWEKLEGGVALLSPSLVSYRGEVIRIGGMNARNAKGEPNDLHSTQEVVAYDPKTGHWRPLPSLPRPRSSGDAAVFGDTLFLGGGWLLTGHGEGDWFKTVLTLDLRAPEKGWQESAQPFARRALATVVHGRKVWFLGGMDENAEPSLQVDWFEPETGRWGKGPKLPPGPMAGFGVAACEQGGQLLVSPLSGEISRLAPDEQSWQVVAKMAAPRFFHRILPMPDGRLVAVGGSSRKGQIKELELIALGEPEPAKTAAAKAPWPQWRGPNRDGVSAEAGWRKTWPAEGPPLLWRAEAGAGMSSPVVAEGRLILHGNDGQGTDTVKALEAGTGQERWHFSFPCASVAHEMPIVPPGNCATPTIAGGKVYALSREGQLVCLEATTGAPVWQKNLVIDLGSKRPVYGYAQSPLVEEGRIFLDLGAEKDATGSTAALDAATGAVLWKNGTGEAGYSSARMLERDGKKFVAMFKGEALDLFDPATGRTLWSYRTSARDFCNAVTPTLVGHRLLVSNTGTDEAALLDWDTGADEPRPLWTNKQFSLLFNSPIEQEGCLFAFNEKRRGHHEFTCVDGQTGESRWVSDAVNTGTFILADGHWIFLTREGEIVLAPATAGGLTPGARFKTFEGKFYATPVLAEGLLYVRSNAGALAVYDLRSGAGELTAAGAPFG